MSWYKHQHVIPALWIKLILSEILLSGVGAVCDGYIGELKAQTYKQVVTSPNYPQEYDTNLVCRWVLSTDRYYEVIRFEIVDLAISESANCADDYVEIKDGLNSWSPVIRRYCGTSVNNLTPLTSSNPAVTVLFKTDGKYSDAGFKLTYWSVPKDEVMFTKPVWNISNYITLGVFFAILCFIAVSMVTIAILRRIHFGNVRDEKKRREAAAVLKANNLHEAVPRDASCDSVNTECNTTRTSIGESTSNLASLL